MSLGSITAQNAALAGIYGDNKGADAPASFLGHLYEGDPTDDGVEISGGGYAPPTIANTTANFGTPAGGELGPFVLDFGTPTGDWGTPDFWALTDGSGNFFNVQEISDPVTIDATSGDVTVTPTITAD